MTGAGPPGPNGGGQFEVYYLSKGLAALGHKILWITPDTEGSADSFDVNINVVRLSSLSFVIHNPAVHAADFFCSRIIGSPWSEAMKIVGFGPFIPQTYPTLRRMASEVDLIHALPLPFSFCHFAYRAASKADRPFVITPFFPARSMDTDRTSLYYNRPTIDLLQHADAVQVPSAWERNLMIDLGVDAARVHIIPPCFDVDEYGEARGSRFREKHSLGDARIVLFVGRKTLAKGAIHLLRAMRLVQLEIPETVLVAVGERTPEWVTACRREPSVPIVDIDYLYGQQKADVFDACDVFAMPSISDDFGRVYAEAWLRRKPVVACPVGGVDEVLGYGTRGLLVEYGDDKAIASAICALLKSPAESDRLGHAGFDYARNNLGMSSIAPKLVQMYDSATEVSRHAI